MRPLQEPLLPFLSIIIPALNEAHCIGATLDAVARMPGTVEVIVVDGGSSDGTAEIARRPGVRVLSSARGRGVQLHRGAQIARGQVLWFLHVDTHPPAAAPYCIRRALTDPQAVGGNFELRFDGTTPAARFMTRLYPHLRKLGLCYGDSAIFVRREAYERVGGFLPFPIFEDLDLVKRLERRGHFVCASAEVRTSSRRFEGRSFATVFARWTVLQTLYGLGVHPSAC